MNLRDLDATAVITWEQAEELFPGCREKFEVPVEHEESYRYERGAWVRGPGYNLRVPNMRLGHDGEHGRTLCAVPVGSEPRQGLARPYAGTTFWSEYARVWIRCTWSDYGTPRVFPPRVFPPRVLPPRD